MPEKPSLSEGGFSPNGLRPVGGESAGLPWAVVILGGGVDAAGHPSPFTRQRVAHALAWMRALAGAPRRGEGRGTPGEGVHEIHDSSSIVPPLPTEESWGARGGVPWGTGVMPWMICSGRKGIFQPAPARTEASAMAELLVRGGIARGRIHLEEVSVDTLGNAHFVIGQYLSALALRRMVVVTSDFHVERTRRIFAAMLPPGVGLHVEGAPTPHLSEAERAEFAAGEQQRLATLGLWLDAVSHPVRRERFFRWLHPGYAPWPGKGVVMSLLGLKQSEKFYRFPAPPAD